MTSEGGYIADLSNQYGGYGAEIWKIVNGQKTTIATGGFSYVPGPLALEFQIVGDELGFYVNGNLIATGVDSTFTGPGTVGLWANGGSETMQDFSAQISEPPAPTYSGLPFNDDFGRPDSLFVGTNWTVQQGLFAIIDDHAENIANSYSIMMANGPSPSDVILSGDVNVNGGWLFGGDVAGLMARMNGNTGYMGELSNENGTVYAVILRDDDGTWVTLDSRSVSSGNGTLRFEVQGSSLDLYLNGAPVAQATDGTYTGTGRLDSRAGLNNMLSRSPTFPPSLPISSRPQTLPSRSAIISTDPTTAKFHSIGPWSPATPRSAMSCSRAMASS